MDNFIVSARKYRPATFESVVGQQHITNTLKNAIKNNQLAQAFLFCGPRGVGKTTCARILAKTINCENLQPNGEACGVCASCQSFQNGNSFNVHELDAASNNSVDDIRSLIEQVRIPPQGVRYKIYTTTAAPPLPRGASCSINVTFTPTVTGNAQRNHCGDRQLWEPTAVGDILRRRRVERARCFADSRQAELCQPGSWLQGARLRPLRWPTWERRRWRSDDSLAEICQTNTCGASLAAAAGAHVRDFSPTAGGNRALTLNVTDNASPPTQSVSLSGVAFVPVPVASLSPKS